MLTVHRGDITGPADRKRGRQDFFGAFIDIIASTMRFIVSFCELQFTLSISDTCSREPSWRTWMPPDPDTTSLHQSVLRSARTGVRLGH